VFCVYGIGASLMRGVRPQVTSAQTFRAAPSSYAILCGLFGIPAILWIAYFIRSGRFEPDFFLATFALPSMWAIWLAGFRLRIDATGITYRTLFGAPRRAEYSEIVSVDPYAVAPVSRRPLGIAVNLKDGRRILINAKPFSREALIAIRSLPHSGSNNALERAR
jgi:hypothetical protein